AGGHEKCRGIGSSGGPRAREEAGPYVQALAYSVNQCLESNRCGDSASIAQDAFHPLSVRFRKRCNGSDGVHSRSTLFEGAIVRELAVSAIRITPSPSTVTSLAPASLAARIARAISACVTLAGRRGMTFLR